MMPRLLSCLLILLALVLPHSLLAQQPALTRECQDAFQRLTERVAAGALGPGTMLDNISISPDFARIEAHGPTTRWTATLTHPERPSTTAPRWFTMELKPNKALVHREALGKLLDEVFVESPWMQPHAPAEAQRYRSLIDNLQDDRAAGRLPRLEGTASRGYLAGVLIVTSIALAAVLWLLVWTRPEQP